MDKLKSALGKQTSSKTAQSNNYNHSMKSYKGHSTMNKWLLDPDMMEKEHQPVSSNFATIVKAVVEKKFENQKYIEEETAEEIIVQLTQYLSDVPTQLARLTQIQDAVIEISDSYLGEIKNYLKNFQSLVDVRIRKLKRKQKKSDLSEFDKIVHDKNLMKKRHQVMYIDQDKDEKKHIHRKQNRIKKNKPFQAQSKKSYGTMNSGSNENQSGSGRKSGGSQSRSGESNALTLLLTNSLQRKDQKKPQKHNENPNNQSYDFSAIMSNTIAVRQRNDIRHPKTQQAQLSHSYIQNHSKVVKKQSISDQKDEAFIFHRPPKKGKKPGKY